VLKTPAGFVFVGWESALLAPPERDLWALAESDPGLLDAFSPATGTAIDTDALALHRMWYDLAEISGYACWFRSGHDDTVPSAPGYLPASSASRPSRKSPSWGRRLRAGDQIAVRWLSRQLGGDAADDQRLRCAWREISMRIWVSRA
jgi:hypothetical protein